MNMTSSPILTAIALSHYGVIRAQGLDAATFLHSQLTQDFLLQNGSQAWLAAYCSPKGRVLTNFIALRWAEDDYILLCPRDALATTLKRLAMFVMRAKCILADASSDFCVTGHVFEAAVLNPALANWTLHLQGREQRIVLPAVLGFQREIGIALTRVDPPSKSNVAAELDWWTWLSVHSGIADVGAAIGDQFVPQMLNYESTGAINFKKGCYPGQEVVARSQFRGTIKRRTFLLHSSTPLNVGDAVVLADDANTEAGSIIQTASWGGYYAALACLNVDLAENSILRVAAANCTVQPLPYPLLLDL